MTSIHIDVETFCELNLKEVGAYRYCQHPSFEIMCIHWHLSSGQTGKVEYWSDDWKSQQHDFVDAYSQADYGVAFNAQFERQAFRSTFADRVGLPHGLRLIRRWKCAQVRALRSGLPADLDRCMAAVIPGWGKDKVGHAAMLRLCKPRKPSKKNSATRWTYEARPDDYAAMSDYCGTDVKGEYYVWNITRDLEPQEWELYWLDQQINDRGVRIDPVTVGQFIEVAEARKEQLNQWALDNHGITLGQVARIGQICGLPAADKATLANALESPETLTEAQIGLITARLQFGKTSVNKYKAMSRAVCDDGRLHGMFQMYGAAATNRWAGRIVQLHNLPRKGEDYPEQAIEDVLRGDLDWLEICYGSTMDLLSRLIRPMLIPADGYAFEVCDYAAVEARVIGWLADCKFYMEEYRGEGKLYEAMAGQIFGVPKEEIGKDDPRRHLGKAVILGCGFQMGEDKFVDQARKEGSEEPEGVLRRAHAAYRASVPEISDYETGLWAAMNAAAIHAVQNPDKIVTTANGKIKFGVRGDWLYMILPSGKPLAYYKPELKFDENFRRWGVTYMGIDSNTNKWTRLRTYGGKLTENAVQAIAQQLIAHAMHIVEASGRMIVLHVHDELVTEVPVEEANPRELEELMCQLPHWAMDIPIAAEGKTVMRYEK